MAAGDEGYFPRGRSVLRMVQAERAVGLMYGQRALGIGAIAPLNFVGTLLHTHSADKPFERLARTGKGFETIFFGTRAEADAVLDRVHSLHSRVAGELSEDAGPFPAGTPYSALDPELMLWTMAVMADSAEVFYELFVRRLSDDEREHLWLDYVRFAELFGMPRDAAPASRAEFREWFEGKLAGDEAHLSDEARHVGRAIMFRIPVPPSRFLAMRVHNVVMLGSLPPRVRELYGLPWSAAHDAAFRATVAGLKLPRPFVPGFIRNGDNTRSFDLVAGTERRIMATGRPSPGALAAAPGASA